jgi:PAS domain S-box-containing protein
MRKKTLPAATTKTKKVSRRRPQKANYAVLKKRFFQYTQTVRKLGNAWQSRNLKFKQLIENSPLPILITKSQDATIDYVNPAWEKVTGYKRHEAIGQQPSMLQSGKTSPKIYQELWKKLKDGKSYKTELIFNRKKDGTIYQMSSTMFPIKHLGKITYYAQIEHDITKRKRKEKYQTMYVKIAGIISESKTVTQAIPKVLKHLCEAGNWELGELWLINDTAKFLQFAGSWNTPGLHAQELKKANKKITFTRGKGLPGRVWQTGRPAWVLNTTHNAYFPTALMAAKLGLTTALAFPLLVDDQVIGILTFFTTTHREPDNDLLRAMTSLGNYIGQFIEHKRTEALLLKLTHQHELILNGAGEGIYGMDTEGKATFINPAASEMLGWKSEEIIGKDIHTLIHHTHKDGTSYTLTQCPIHTILHDKKAPRTSTEVFWKKNGTSFSVEGVYTPIIEKKQIKGVVVVFKDITERQKMEDLKREFFSIAAHELKTPITSLKLMSQHQLFELNKKGKEAINPQDLKLMDKELDRLTRIINDLLDNQRIETGKLNLHVAQIELSSLITNTIKQVQNLTKTQQITYHSASPITVTADADRIQQVLTNLLTNAIKYAPQSTKIIVSQKVDPTEVTVAVKDHGPGIPINQQSKIFDRFYQIREGRSPGFGLGLYISKQIIENHQGRIWIKSKEGEGSTFYFSLPCKE